MPVNVSNAPPRDYSALKTPQQIAKALNDLKAQAGTSQDVSGAELRALMAQADSLGIGRQAVGNGFNNVDSVFNNLANQADLQAGGSKQGSAHNDKWDADITALIHTIDEIPQSAVTPSAPQAAPAAGASAAVADTQVRADELRALYHTPNDQSCFTAVRQQLGKLMQSGAEPSVLKAAIADCYAAYNDKHGPRQDTRTTQDFRQALADMIGAHNTGSDQAKEWTKYVSDQYPV